MSKILVLDDSRAIADYISAILRDTGYESESLSQPTQLMPMLRNHDFDLLLLDIYMPEIDGIQLLKKIREDASFDSLDIIIVSSITDEHIVAKCLMNGANDYIKKPINDVILTTRVHACLDRRQHLKTREALSQSSNNYQTMIDSAMDGVVGFDDTGCITYSNENLEIMFGFSQGKLIGSQVENLAPEVFAGGTGQSKIDNQRTISRILGVARELIAKKADGSYFPVELTINEVHQGDRVEYTGMVRNLSERRQHQKRILQFSRLMDSSLNEIYMFDSKTLKFIEVNQGARDNLGFSMGELRNKTPLDIKAEFTLDAFEERLHLLRTGSENQIEFVTNHQRKDGSLYPVEVHLQLMPEEPPVFVAFVLDITHRQKIEQELACAQRQLFQSQKLESLGTLAGGIAHDFNNILAIIEGNTELALDYAELGDEQFEHLQSILTASDKAVNLVRQILAFGRTEDHEFVAINLVDAINESLSLVRPLIPANITIKQHIDVTRPVIMGDKTQIHQIFTNLINNASQAMENNGGVITISIRNDNECVAMSIADTGSGIPVKEQMNIFDPFFTTKKLGKGTGLGLSVVHQLVEHHEGSISLDSSSKGGSDFVIRIPRTENVLEEVNLNREPLISGSGRILVVDDEPELCHLCKVILKSSGYEVVTKGDGQSALELFKKNPMSFDLVLTDYTMPGLTGIELAKALLAIRPELPIILLTGFTKNFNKESAQEMGISYLLKPVNRADLLSCVNEHIKYTNESPLDTPHKRLAP